MVYYQLYNTQQPQPYMPWYVCVPGVGCGYLMLKSGSMYLYEYSYSLSSVTLDGSTYYYWSPNYTGYTLLYTLASMNACYNWAWLINASIFVIPPAINISACGGYTTSPYLLMYLYNYYTNTLTSVMVQVNYVTSDWVVYPVIDRAHGLVYYVSALGNIYVAPLSNMGSIMSSYIYFTSPLSTSCTTWTGVGVGVYGAYTTVHFPLVVYPSMYVPFCGYGTIAYNLENLASYMLIPSYYVTGYLNGSILAVPVNQSPANGFTIYYSTNWGSTWSTLTSVTFPYPVYGVDGVLRFVQPVPNSTLLIGPGYMVDLSSGSVLVVNEGCVPLTDTYDAAHNVYVRGYLMSFVNPDTTTVKVLQVAPGVFQATASVIGPTGEPLANASVAFFYLPYLGLDSAQGTGGVGAYASLIGIAVTNASGVASITFTNPAPYNGQFQVVTTVIPPSNLVVG